MEKMIARCGLICSSCPAFIATKNNDNKLREETAKNWSEMFSSNIRPEDINCLGCLSTNTKKLCFHCSQCEIRKCAFSMKVENCAYCDSYETCGTINGFLRKVPEAKKTLDEIRKTL